MKMLGVLCLALLGLSNATFTPADAEDLTEGFIQGIQANPSDPDKCSGVVNMINGSVVKLGQDVQAALAGNLTAVPKALNDIVNIMTQAQNATSDCDFSGLITQLKKIMGPDGAGIISWNYAKHLFTINADLDGIRNCPNNYKTCGKDIGEVLRLLTGWSLKSSLRVSTGNYDFYGGVIHGLSKTNTSQCAKNWIGLEPQYDEISNDLKKLEGGDIFVIGSLVGKIDDVEKDINSWNTVCNYTGFENVFAGLLTKSGVDQVVTNYLTHYQKINADFGSIGGSASQSTQGYNLGEGVRLLLGWGI